VKSIRSGNFYRTSNRTEKYFDLDHVPEILSHAQTYRENILIRSGSRYEFFDARTIVPENIMLRSGSSCKLFFFISDRAKFFCKLDRITKIFPTQMIAPDFFHFISSRIRIFLRV